MPIAKKTKRNQKLYRDFTSQQFTLAQLVAKYKVSQTRLYQLVKNEQKSQQEGATV